MKILELKSKKIIEVNPFFGGRLIEQGKAIMAPLSPVMKKEPKAEKAQTEEEPQKARRKKG